MREGQVDEGVVVDGDTHKCADKLEVDVGFEGLSVEPVQMVVLVVMEHHELWVEDFFHDTLEVFFSYATYVNGWFVKEPHRKRKFQLVTSVNQLDIHNFLQ